MTLSDAHNPSTSRDTTLGVTGEDDFAFPLSFAQQRLWFLTQLEPESPAYNIPAAYRLSGPLNVPALEQSFSEIVRRHEALRTTFAAIDGQLFQVVGPHHPRFLPVVDLRGLLDGDKEARAMQLATEDAQRPFDLAQGPLFRATLVQLTEEENVLLLNMHHIVSDGWSIGVFLQELATLYDAFSTGKSCLLPELSIQYADFAIWQLQWLQGEVLENQLSYWMQQLGGSPPMLELPTDRPRPTVQTYRGARQSVTLPAALTQALKTLSQCEGVTLFMTLLAAFQVLLHRYTGQDDITVGSPIAGRNQVEIEELIGFFVNTLVLRTNLSGDPPFREFLGRVREVALGAYGHQELPFERLVEELQPERSLSHSPLFQVMFILQNAPRAALELAGLTLRPMEVDSGTAKFDLTLSISESADGLRGVWEYNTDLFEASTISRLKGHFQTLLEGILAHPEQRLSVLPLLTAAERQQLLIEWNDTIRDYPKDQCLHQLIEAQVERTPDAVAVVFEDGSLTYQELNARANQLAHHLRALGVGPEGLVGLCMERSLEMVIGLLGILKASGAYVPLDPAYPKERVAFMLEDAQIPVLLTQKQLVGGLPEHGARVVCLDADWEIIAQESEASPASRVAPVNLAYVIYTSGSTGQPKGVQIPHHAVVSILESMRQQPGLTAPDVLLAITTLSFDIAALELFLPLSVGARVELVSHAVATDGKQLLQTLADTHATVMQATPATWRLLLEAGWAGSTQLTVLCGGEALPRELALQLLARAAAVWNLYGPTETTLWSAVAKVELEDGPVPLGRPIANTQVYLLDRHLHPVPVGVPGELYIGGVGLARGYLNRHELTAEKFISNPFSSELGARMYKTGDLALYRTDGTIQFLGRLDHQVKVRGFRLELGEIEAVLRQYPSLRDSVVAAHQESSGEKRLVAYVVPHVEQTLTISELRSFLKASLPKYKIPSVFVFLEALPLTPRGKVDRHALPQPEGGRPELESSFVAPHDALERQLAHLWEELLGVTPIGVEDDFFELGGHSLLAVRLFAQIEKIFGRNLPLAILFQAPTIEQLANILRQEAWSAPWSSLVAIQPRGLNPPFFCVHGHDGNVLFYRDLARYLGLAHPFYGLQAQGLDGKQPRHSRIEDIAAHYIEEIQTLQSEGPYYLGGYCFGGWVAFEMAQQLHAQGQHVALLSLFDAYAPGSRKALPRTALPFYKIRRFVQRVHHYTKNVLLFEPKERFPYVLEKAREARRRLKMSRRMGSLWRRILGALPGALQEIEAANLQTIENYIPHIYPGRLTLFRASTQPAGYDSDPQMGWGDLAAGGVEVCVVPGYCGSMVVEPRVRVLADRLRACLNKAQAANSSS